MNCARQEHIKRVLETAPARSAVKTLSLCGEARVVHATSVTEVQTTATSQSVGRARIKMFLGVWLVRAAF